MTGAVPTGALRDLKVVDMTHFLAGPFCTMMLADQGADVLKVEPPSGDVTRTFGPFLEGDEEKAFAGYFHSVNRNKRSVTVDLKTDAGREALLALIDDADVIVENYRAGVMERFGLGWEALHARNPRLVYAAIRGFGDARTLPSPYADWPAYDVVAQAFGGVMAITGERGGAPTKVGPGIGDILPAMHCAFGIMCAVHHARNSGEGQFVDISMADSILALCERSIHQHAYSGMVAGPEGNHQPFLCPFGTFPTADGACTITAYDDRMFALMCRLCGLEALAADPRFGSVEGRFEHRDALIEAISAFTATKTKAEMMEILGGHVPFGPVYNTAEIFVDPHFRAREMLVDLPQPGTDRTVTLAGTPVKLAATPGGVRQRAPRLGEHTSAAMQETGLDPARIEALRAAGAFGPVAAVPTQQKASA
ncbi:succinate--mesaconate CoA-transferase [Albimonas donghaensis]|uniref:Succinate--mesaconate CoA-transferase n=1 Tax=Albimonas donghaensis TaxID=356660 RepID=A0A1H3DTK9_9RHOB|nr:CoA transferase [Albimonas donghaensis]SDX69745.1 succinate--mesaconate CoA-transferase [Albimonas donghaensis]